MNFGKKKENSEEAKENNPAAEAGSKQPEKVELTREEHGRLLDKIAELEALKDKYLRGAADFDNAKKRIARERDEFFKYALEGLLYDLLPVLDNFERALAHGETSGQTKSLSDGFQLIYKQLFSRLNECGLKRIESVGKMFDPHIHEAVERVACDHEPDGKIIEEVLAGYEFNGKLLRPPKVKTAGKPDACPEVPKEEELT